MCVINKSLVLNTESYIANITIHCYIKTKKSYTVLFNKAQRLEKYKITEYIICIYIQGYS
jgi:hypothetical protein